jgi:hypothetical protein
MTDEECTRVYNEANNITIKNPPITTQRIFAAMRAVAAQRQWVGLTDEEIEQEFGFIDELLRDCVHRTEAKLKEKNT